MYGNAPVYRLQTLNRFQGRSCSIFYRFPYGHAPANASGCVNTGSLGFIWKTYEIRITISIKKTDITESRTLSVSQIDNRIIHGSRNHTRCQHHHIRLNLNLFSQKGVIRFDNQSVTIFGYTDNIPFGQKDSFILLYALVKVLLESGCPHVLVKDISLPVIIIFAHILCLFERYKACDRTAVVKVAVIIALAGTLNKDNRFCFLSIRRSCYLALCSDLLKLVISHNIGQLSKSKMSEFVALRLIRSPSGGKDNCAE